jgi:hypothetical protein
MVVGAVVGAGVEMQITIIIMVVEIGVVSGEGGVVGLGEAGV